MAGSEGVVGIQNADGTVGPKYSCYESVLVPNRAIRFRIVQAAFLRPAANFKGGAPASVLTFTETLFN